MKKIIFVTLLLMLLAPIKVEADDRGAWVKVDSDGNAISQAIVCTPDVCGNPNSLYNQLTLQAGERYVQQTVAGPNGNVAGVGAGQSDAKIKVNLETGEWTATRTIQEKIVDEDNQITIIEKTIVQKITTNATPTLISQEVKPIAVSSPTIDSNIKALQDWYANWLIQWNKWLEQIAQLMKGWK